jgi:hypothetical protein
MRKLWIAVVAVAAVLAVVSVALAANTYKVHIAKSSAGKGTLAHPIPTKLDFGYQVGDTEGKRPFVIKQYRIAAEGTRAYPKSRPRCTFEQATDPTVTDPANLSRACVKANVGTGTIKNYIGASSDRTQKAPCDVVLTLINISTGDSRFPVTGKQIKKRGGIAIRIDTDPPACLAPVHEALAAPFYDTKVEGIPTTELRFTVPDTLAHPGGTLDNAVIEVTSFIKKKTGLVTVRRGIPQAAGSAHAAAKRRVGFYSLVGRKGPKRTVRVTFVDESGAKTTATATAPTG